jgi:hypothetical protein
MHCSNCSAPIKPIVSFDIDGTMGDYHNHFLHFAATYMGYAHYESDYDGSQPFKSWFCEAFEVDLRTFRDIKLAYRQGAQKRSMPVRGWARPAAVAAREAGAELWITTTRPYMRLDNVDPDTRFWLKRYGIKYDYLIYGEHKYEELSKQVDPERVCFLLDDLPEQIILANLWFGPGPCYLYGTMWNRAQHNGYQVVTEGEDIVQLAKNKVEAWKSEH